jgi:hypothetical protein
MSKTSDTRQEEGAEARMPLAANGQTLIYSMARMQGQAVRAALNMQIETLGFLRRRYELDLKLIDLLTGFDGFENAFNTYSEFWNDTVREYSDEAGKIVSIGSKQAAEAAKDVRWDAERISGELAERSVI